MSKTLVGLIAGLLFGTGLAVSQMISQAKVIGFLDVFGNWDPSLAFVMGGAVAVTAILFRVILRRPRPLLEYKFQIAETIGIDRRLVIGSAIFGVGWGLGGFCPGPGVASLSLAQIGPVVFVVAVVAGSLVCKKWISSSEG